MRFHLNRSKTLLGRMKVLHGLPHPRNPRVPAKKKHKRANPLGYCMRNSPYFSQSCRGLIHALSKHKPGLPFPAFDAVGVVYAIFFMVAGSEEVKGSYVGYTHRSVAERFEEHIREAKDHKEGLRILDGDALKLYGRMASLGIANCYIIPLQTIEGALPAHSQDFIAAAKRYEREWIRLLDSRENGMNSNIPGGATTMFSSLLDSFNGWTACLWHPVRYLYRSHTVRVGGFAYHYRDYVRRFQRLLERRHLVGAQSLAAVMSTIRRRNLERMVAVASLHSIEGVLPDDQNWLVHVLIDELDTRVQNHQRRGKKAIKMFLPSFVSVLMDDLPLAKILANAESASLLPHQMRHVHVMLGFRNSVPIGRRWFNYRKFFAGHTTEELQAIADGPCSCHLPEYDRFKISGCDHVTTCSSDFLKEKFPHLPHLAGIWDRGSKYRPHSYDLDSPEHRGLIIAELEATMQSFKQRMAAKFEMDEHCLQPWFSDVLGKMRVALQHLADPSFAPLGPTHAPAYSRAERDAMDGLLKGYVCMPVDKLSNNMFMACSCYMAQVELEELNAGVADQDATYVTVSQSAHDILTAADLLFAESQLVCSIAELPFHYPIPKLHKPQLAFRFITSCSRFYLKNVAVWVTSLMRAIEVDLKRLWRTLNFPTSLKFGESKPWLIRNSAGLVPMVRRFNICQDLQESDAAPPFQHSYDCEKLFTKLNQSDLRRIFRWLLGEVFRLHDKPLIKVRKGMAPKWMRGQIPARRTGRDEGAAFYIFDLAMAIRLVEFLIDNAFFCVGSSIYHQVQGIPMGISPASYFANYYLLAYEFLFFKDALQVLSQATSRLNRNLIRQSLHAFRFVARYADDLSLINRVPAVAIERLFYVNQTYAGVHGVYPTCLTLHSTGLGAGRVLHALDVEVLPAHGASGPLITRLYDKRRSPQFQDITIVQRFPAWDSMLPWSCKLNVFNSQFDRFAEIITDGDNFVDEVVKLLVEMLKGSYPIGHLFHRCRQCCLVTPMLFGMARGTRQGQVGRPLHGLYPVIRHEVRRALPHLDM